MGVWWWGLRRVKARSPAHDQVELALCQAQSGCSGALTPLTSRAERVEWPGKPLIFHKRNAAPPTHTQLSAEAHIDLGTHKGPPRCCGENRLLLRTARFPIRTQPGETGSVRGWPGGDRAKCPILSVTRILPLKFCLTIKPKQLGQWDLSQWLPPRAFHSRPLSDLQTRSGKQAPLAGEGGEGQAPTPHTEFSLRELRTRTALRG